MILLHFAYLVVWILLSITAINAWGYKRGFLALVAAYAVVSAFSYSPGA